MPDEENPLVFSLTDASTGQPSPYFAVDAIGQIVVKTDLDYEALNAAQQTAQQLNLTAQNGLGESATVPVAITITNVVEPAQFSSQDSSNLAWSEFTPVNPVFPTVLGHVSAVDEYGPISDFSIIATTTTSPSGVTQSLGGGSNSVPFDVNSNGEIVLTGSLDYEQVSSYDLTIQANDPAKPSLDSNTSVTIDVIDGQEFVVGGGNFIGGNGEYSIATQPNGDITFTLGVAGRSEDDLSQLDDYHGAYVLLPPGDGYAVSYIADLSTWDSYNKDLLDGHTGPWDSFSISITDQPYPDLTNLSYPLQNTPNEDFKFVWGGSSYNDGNLETYQGTGAFTVASNPAEARYLNVILDTRTAAHDNQYPSWGTVTLTGLRLLPQLLSLSLVEDTGTPGDGVTTNPAIHGKIETPASVSPAGKTIQIDVDGDQMSDVTAITQADGSFTVDEGAMHNKLLASLPAGASVYRTYTIAARIGSDGEWAPLTFTYNRLPVANDDSAIEVILGDTKIIDPKANDSDVVTNGMFISSVGTATYGTVAISGGGQSIFYTPIPGAGGVTDSFTYTIDDGYGETATATVTITVTFPQVNLRGHRTGGKFGETVTEDIEDGGDPAKYLVLTNNDFEETPDPNNPQDGGRDFDDLHATISTAGAPPIDDDLAKVTLQGLPEGLNEGSIEIILSDSTAVRLFTNDGSLLYDAFVTGSGPLTIDFASPNGYLGG